MAYKFEIKGYYFKVTDTVTSDILINETRETLKWTINEDGEYQFIQKGAVPQSIDGVSPTLLRIGRSFDFADIVDSSGSAFASETVLQDFLSAYVGYICCSEVDIELNGSNIGSVPGGTILELDLEDTTGATVTPNSSTLSGSQLTLVFPVSATPIGAKLMKTGISTTSYRTGDDANTNRGRLTDFLTLSSNNKFGNTSRYTDTSGGSTYADGVLIDHSTDDGTEILCYYIGDLTTTRTWADSVDWALSLSALSLSGWGLANIDELFNISDKRALSWMNYSPFNATLQFWSSTAYSGGAALVIYGSNRQITGAGILNNYRAIATRYCTYAELGL